MTDLKMTDLGSDADKDRENEYAEKEDGEKKKKILRRFAGISLAFVNCLATSLTALMVKILSDVSPNQIAATTGLAILVSMTLLLLHQKKKPIPEEKRGTLLFLCVLGAYTLIPPFVPYGYLPLADSSPIFFSTPLFVPILALMFLKESFTLLDGVSAALAMVGVILIARPPFLFGEHTCDILRTSIGIIMAFISVFFKSIVFILSRNLKDIYLLTVLFYYSLMMIFCATVSSFWVGPFNFELSLEHWLLYVGACLLGLIAQFCFIKSLQIEKAGIISIVNCISIVFALLWQYILMNEEAKVMSILGAVLVGTSVILVSVRKLLEEPEEK